jgi:uncharacterized membrane protein YfcA
MYVRHQHLGSLSGDGVRCDDRWKWRIEMKDMSRTRRLLLLLVGVCAGFLSGFLGVGGGLVIVPALMLLFGYSIKRAVGTSLATIVPVSIVAILADLEMKPANIHWMIALALTAGSFFGSIVGARLLRRLPDTPLRTLFAGALLIAAYRMLPTFGASSDGLMLLREHRAMGDALALPIGVLAGMASTLFGLGGGIVTVPCLQVLFRDISFHAARATSLVTIAPTSGFGALQHQRIKTVDFEVVRRLVPTALVGSVLGVVCVNFIAASACRAVFAVLLVVTAARLLMIGHFARVPNAQTGAAIGTEQDRAIKRGRQVPAGEIGHEHTTSTAEGTAGRRIALAGGTVFALAVASAAVMGTPDRGADFSVSSASLSRQVELVNKAAVDGRFNLAAFTWQDAYALALASHQWEGVLAVGDAALAIGDASRSRVGWTPKARDCYTIALFRARRQASLEGVLQATKRLSRLGDDDAVARGIAIASALASSPESRARVQEVATRAGQLRLDRVQAAGLGH